MTHGMALKPESGTDQKASIQRIEIWCFVVTIQRKKEKKNSAVLHLASTVQLKMRDNQSQAGPHERNFPFTFH